jgi:hypothetical protein
VTLGVGERPLASVLESGLCELSKNISHQRIRNEGLQDWEVATRGGI